MDTKPRKQKDLKATQYVLLLSSIYYHIQLYPRQIDHNQMNHSWNKNFTEVGYCVVVGGDKVDINSVHQNTTTIATITDTFIYDASVILSTSNDGNMSDYNGTK